MKLKLLIAAYALAIIGANIMLKRFGMWNIAGLVFPSGVVLAGASFSIRDELHEKGGTKTVIAAILAGAGVSLVVSPSFAVASAVAFLISEGADMAVYAPLRKNRRYVAMIASNVVGSTIDSLAFLWLAFGTTQGWLNLTIIKSLCVTPFALAAFLRRKG